jgi:4-aminobutyrate aminotransferase-like enzyme
MERVLGDVRGVGFALGIEFFPGLQEKRTSAAEAVVGMAFMARLKPCPSSRVFP